MDNLNTPGQEAYRASAESPRDSEGLQIRNDADKGWNRDISSGEESKLSMGQEDVRVPIPWGRLSLWSGVTAVTAIICFAAVQPQSCSEVKACLDAYHESVPDTDRMSMFAVGGLGTAVVLEAVSLVLAYKSATPIIPLIKGVEETFMPPALLCMALFVLLLENSCFAFSKEPWFVHASRAVDGRPVFSIYYMEWVINVPVLLIVSGKCAMFRSLAEVSRPLIVTNIYMIFAWSAHFIENSIVRWVLVGITFAMFGWASFDMVNWAIAFRQKAAEDLPSRTFRPILTFGLIVLFGIYGVMYVLALEDQVSTDAERVFFQANNFGAKFLMLVSFAGIRASQYHDLITTLLVNANTGFQRQAAMAGVDDGWDASNQTEKQQFKGRVVAMGQ